MLRERVSIGVAEAGAVTGEIFAPEDHCARTGTGLILAHGAGNDMAHPLLVTLSEGLAQAGYVTLRFNFPYREKGIRSPDSQNTLVLAWQSAYQSLKRHEGCAPGTVVAAGKSMGGRVASQMVAKGLLPVTGLLFFGYPLHPPSNKDKTRDAHLYDIRIPMLFFVGPHDRLCDLTVLKSVLSRLESSDLETIEGGDHSFRLPKSASITKEDVYDQIFRKTLDWLGTLTEGR